jgi:hypothetical protein
MTHEGAVRLVSREMLNLGKALRAQGYSVFFEPEDGSKLNFYVRKGF